MQDTLESSRKSTSARVASQRGAQSLTALPTGLGGRATAEGAAGAPGAPVAPQPLVVEPTVQFAVLKKGKQGRTETRSVFVPAESGLATTFAAGQAAIAAEKAIIKGVVLQYARDSAEREAAEEDEARARAAQGVRWSGGKGGSFGAGRGGGGGKGGGGGGGSQVSKPFGVLVGARACDLLTAACLSIGLEVPHAIFRLLQAVMRDLDGGRGSFYANLPLRQIKQRAIPTIDDAVRTAEETTGPSGTYGGGGGGGGRGHPGYSSGRGYGRGGGRGGGSGRGLW